MTSPIATMETIETIRYKEEFKCSLCYDICEGFGNNPYPLCEEDNTEARCCDDCNTLKVVPARIAQLFKKEVPEEETTAPPEEEEEEDDGWMDVYNRPAPFRMFIHPDNEDLAHLSTGIFYQTYGGGLEGGFVKMPDGTLHKVERTWGIPFTIQDTFVPSAYTWESRPADDMERPYFQIKITIA